MTRCAIDPRILEQGRSLACAASILRRKIDPCRQLLIAARNIEATDHTVNDGLNVLNKIVRARRQSRAMSREKIEALLKVAAGQMTECEPSCLDIALDAEGALEADAEPGLHHRLDRRCGVRRYQGFGVQFSAEESGLYDRSKRQRI
jgi:hypothetical protein